MKHRTHDKEIMMDVMSRCKNKFPHGHAISDAEWNCVYDNVLCDNIIATLEWKIKNLSVVA